MKTLPTILATMLLAMPALADNHGTGDAPWRHEPAAQQSPVCRVYDGDIPARAFDGEWQACPSGVKFEGMNCIEFPSKPEKGTLIRISRLLFGDGNAVAIIEPSPAIIPSSLQKPRRVGAVDRCEYGHEWWCKSHRRAPGQDEDRQASDRDIAANDPPARSEPPENREPSREETRSPMSSDNEREVQDRADRRQRDRDRQNAMMHGD